MALTPVPAGTWRTFAKDMAIALGISLAITVPTALLTHFYVSPRCPFIQCSCVTAEQLR